uniref:Thionin-like protein 2 n=1 Tax=Nelumbo nucifera TaxID=4432 RepID=A0A822YEQ2_NELNU|nr:TPA_asm: hypothetical protein HUJ06_031197 [Nelumbo nucifera]
MRAIMVLALVMLATTVSASFTECYPACFGLCVIIKHTPKPCAISCLKHCIPTSRNDPHYPCTSGCAYSKCSNIKEVEACVNGCSQTCSKKH